MDCESVERMAHRYLDDQVGGEERDAIREHLRHCGECAELLERLAKEDEFFSRAFAGECATSVSALQILKRVEDAKEGRHRGPRRPIPLRPRVAWSAAAAAAIAALLLALLTGRQSPEGEALVIARITAAGAGVVVRSAAGQTRNGARGMAVRLGESIDAQGGAQALRPPGGLGWAAQITTTGGNLVILNRGTLARFTREHQIEIERGEVFVEVVDRRKMFIAEAKGATVEVHGTEFNLALAQGRGEVTVTVAEGTVLFSNRHGSCSVRAGGQSCAAGENAPAPPIRVALQPIVAWAGVSVTEPAAVRLSLPSGLNQALFAGGEIPTLLVRIGYLFDEYVPLGLECRVLDVASGVVARSAEPISGPGFRYTNRRVTFGQLKPGTYRAEVRLEGRDDLLAETRFNVRP